MLLMVACKKTNVDTGIKSEGFIFVMSNQTDTNRILVYNRLSDGNLLYKETKASGGKGYGNRLGSQGGVSLSSDGKWLLSVNGGSNTVSAFSISSQGINLVSTVASNGITPVSVTCYNNLVAVVNSGENGNLVLFRISPAGELTPIQGATKILATSPSVPGQVSFTKDGTMLVITLKQANKILGYKIDASGTIGSNFEINSNIAVPFGFAIGTKNQIFVSEPGSNAVSIYSYSTSGFSKLGEPFFPKQQGPCWVTALANGNYFYVANAGTNNVSGFKVNSDNSLTLLNDGIVGLSGQRTIDIVSSPDSKFVYTLNADARSIRVYEVKSDGLLEVISDRFNLPSTVTAFAIK
jgi:hypothetical protein